jgi:hypothetical protein
MTVLNAAEFDGSGVGIAPERHVDTVCGHVSNRHTRRRKLTVKRHTLCDTLRWWCGLCVLYSQSARFTEPAKEKPGS